MRASTAFRLFLLVPICAAFIGCSSKSTLSGTVTIDGQAVKGGDLVFEGAGVPTCYATVSEDGSYSLQRGGGNDVVPGKYDVTFRIFEEVPSSNPNAAPGRRLVSPKKYSSTKTSGLSFTVQPRTKSVYDIELESQP